MSDNVLITPASRKIEFFDSAANVDAKIETDSSGNLLITNTGGDISIGDTSSDIFVGDGTNSIDIVFEQSGEIRGLTGVTLTLGQSDSNVQMATDLDLNTNDIINVNNLTVGGYLAGPSTFTIDPAGVGDNTGTVVIAGNLQVDGTTTTINSTTVTVDDLNLTLASGAANAAAANGAGLTVDGANATITYDSSNDEWDFNKNINITGNLILSGTVDGRDVATDGSKLDGIESGATADQTASEILTAIKTVDGSGSGLDADLLDGQHGSYYYSPANAPDPTLTLTGDASGSATFTNLGNATLSVTVANDSHTHDSRYYTESEVNTFINRSYVSNHSATNLAVGWYTIAQNVGDRAVARFALWDTNSGDHQAVIFYASHHFGTDASNTLTVLDNSYYSGNPFRYIRIKDAGTYDGAALQVYIDDASNSVNIAIVGDDVQTSGWDIVNFLADATAPSLVSNWANFGERSKIDLNQIAQGGFATTGPIYADGDTTQYRVFNDNYHPNADAWTTARTITLGGDLSGSVSIDGSTNVTLNATVADDSHNHVISNIDGLQTQLDAKLNSSSYTASDVLTKIKTVDGTGSGLDADLLDGQQGSYYLNYQNLTNTPGAAARIEEFPTVTNGSASVTMANSYTLNRLDVYLNGARMKSGTDYSVSGTTLTFTENLQTGDIVAIYAYDLDVNNLITGNWSDLNDVSVIGAATNTMVRFDGSNYVAASTTEDSSGNLSVSGNATLTGDLTVNGGQVTMPAVAERDKYRVWNSSAYAIGMDNNFTFGGLATEYAMTFQMNDQAGRGFWWGDNIHTDAQGAMALTTNGKLTVAHSARIGHGETDTTTPGATHALDVNGSVSSTAGTNVRTFIATNGTQYVSLVSDLTDGGYNPISAAGDVGIIFTTDNDNTTDESGKGLVIAPWAQTAAKGIKIQEDGKVGVGTSSPSTELEVNGTITDDVGDVRIPRWTAISTATTIANEGVYYCTGAPTVTLGSPAVGTIMTIYNNNNSAMTLNRGSGSIAFMRKGADNDQVNHTSATLGGNSTTTVTIFNSNFAVVTGTDVT